MARYLQPHNYSTRHPAWTQPGGQHAKRRTWIGPTVDSASKDCEFQHRKTARVLLCYDGAM